MKDHRSASVLSEEEIRRLGRLSFLFSRKMGGLGPGEQLSKQVGQGADFAGYQEYQLGDDLRNLDWNLYARMDRLYLKRFAEEREMTIHILVDSSSSMLIGDPPKLAVAKKITAGLSYVGLHRFHRVGVGFFSDTVREKVPSVKGEGHLTRILRALHHADGMGTTDLTRSLKEYGEISSVNGFIILISDLFVPGGYEEGLLSLIFMGYRIGIVHLISPEDQSPFLEGVHKIHDVETGEECYLEKTDNPLNVYRRRMTAYQAGLREFCRKRGIYYTLQLTTAPLEQILWDLLKGLRRGM